MSERILSHFISGLAHDNMNINFMINGEERNLPLNKIYDFWNDYLSLEHDLDIKEIPSNYTPIIIDILPMVEIDTVTIGKICEKITNEIKALLINYYFDYRCFIFQNVEDNMKLRLYFTYFWMDNEVINDTFIKRLLEIFSDDLIRGLSIPNVINLFDVRSGYKLYGIVKNSKFKTIENVKFSFVNKDIKEGNVYITYFSLLKKYRNDQLYPIIFSINNQKPAAINRCPSNPKSRVLTEVFKKNIVKDLKDMVQEDKLVLNNCVINSSNENVEVPLIKINKMINEFNQIDKRIEQIHKIDSSKVSIFKEIDTGGNCHLHVTNNIFLTMNKPNFNIELISRKKEQRILTEKLNNGSNGKKSVKFILNETTEQLKKELEDEKYILSDSEINIYNRGIKIFDDAETSDQIEDISQMDYEDLKENLEQWKNDGLEYEEQKDDGLEYEEQKDDGSEYEEQKDDSLEYEEQKDDGSEYEEQKDNSLEYEEQKDNNIQVKKSLGTTTKSNINTKRIKKI